MLFTYVLLAAMMVPLITGQGGSDGGEYENLGCFNDRRRRAISGRKIDYRTNTIKNCFNLAKARGNLYFAVQYKTQCFTSKDAGRTYNKYGRASATKCTNGTGGTWVMNVYTRLVSPCPNSHPYSYLEGKSCCKYDEEKVVAKDGVQCDGGVIGLTSKCCKDDADTPCVKPPCKSSDINECRTRNGGCDLNAVCTNTVGSRTCKCNQKGLKGDGVYCYAKLQLTNAAMEAVHLGDYSADKAIDGNTGNGNGLGGNCAHSAKKNPNQWWTAELSRDAVIDRVNIYPRTDCCQDRYVNVKIWIKAEAASDWTLCKDLGNSLQTQKGWAEGKCETAFSRGKYIKITQEGKEEIQLCEVEVYGKLLPAGTHWYPQGKVTFGARDDKKGKFKVTGDFKADSFLVGMMLEYSSGYVSCWRAKGRGTVKGYHIDNLNLRSKFGCSYPRSIPYVGVGVTTKNRALIFPRYISWSGWYKMAGYNGNSSLIAWSNRKNPMPISKDDELQIWYLEDLLGRYENDNHGHVTVDVYALIKPLVLEKNSLPFE